MSVATKDHIRLRQGFGGQEERKEKPVFEGFFVVLSRLPFVAKERRGVAKSGRPLIKHPSGKNDILAVVQAIC